MSSAVIMGCCLDFNLPKYTDSYYATLTKRRPCRIISTHFKSWTSFSSVFNRTSFCLLSSCNFWFWVLDNVKWFNDKRSLIKSAKFNCKKLDSLFTEISKLIRLWHSGRGLHDWLQHFTFTALRFENFHNWLRVKSQLAPKNIFVLLQRVDLVLQRCVESIVGQSQEIT